MKRALFVSAVALFVLAVAAVSFGDGLNPKAGDTVYACNCGPACACNTMSNNPGKCTCGTDMVKASVSKVEGDTAYLTSEGWKETREFKTKAKYVCACGPACKCDTISQNPGKCTCGTEMKKAD